MARRTDAEKQILFRPTEFSLDLDSEGEEIELKFIRKSFCGPYYQNFFKVGKKETIVLYHKEPLDYVQKIKIAKRIS